MYETSLDTYNKLLHDNITKTYKHGSEDTISAIENELKILANKLEIGDRMDHLHNRLTFDLCNKKEINYHSWKEHTKISKIAEFSCEIL